MSQNVGNEFPEWFPVFTIAMYTQLRQILVCVCVCVCVYTFYISYVYRIVYNVFYKRNDKLMMQNSRAFSINKEIYIIRYRMVRKERRGDIRDEIIKYLQKLYSHRLYSRRSGN